MNLRVGLAWVYREVCAAAPGGVADVDAFLANEELPSQAAERERRLAVVTELGEVG